MNKKKLLAILIFTTAAAVLIFALILEDFSFIQNKPSKGLIAKITEFKAYEFASVEIESLKKANKLDHFKKIKIICEDASASKSLEKEIRRDSLIDSTSAFTLEITCYEEDDLMIFQLSYFHNLNKVFENYFKQKKSSVDFSTEL